LPFEKEPKFYSGELIFVENIEDVADNTISFCSFDSKNIVVLSSPQECAISDFEIHRNELTSEHTRREEYYSTFEKLMEPIRSGRLKKVVLSKIKEAQITKDPIDIFNDLNAVYKNTFNYLFSSKEMGCWMGATPELLLKSEENKIETVSLAGTLLQNEDWTEKEQEEQQYVTDFIVSNLENQGYEEVKTDGPNDLSNGIVKHLKTSISAQAGNETSFLKTLESLHPTPATCGIPTAEAKELILKNEAHHRKLYTGFILLNEENPKAFVNLRCMEVSDSKAHLYLGGGLIEKSDADDEWEETERKAQTLERFLR
jgi:isochorismate synthase